MKKNVLMPKYMESFSCIGGQCEDNCCMSSWRIDVGKRPYMRYKSSGDEKYSFLKEVII